LEVLMTVAIPSLKPLHETHSVAFEGAVDADGHILEPPDLRESYIDPKFRNRALRIVVDEDGLEELEIDGKRSSMSRRDSLQRLEADRRKFVGDNARARFGL
jgi:hypothetical protein